MESLGRQVKKEMPKRRVKDGKLGGGKEIPKRGVNG
jgi:hypothetical protein